MLNDVKERLESGKLSSERELLAAILEILLAMNESLNSKK